LSPCTLERLNAHHLQHLSSPFPHTPTHLHSTLAAEAESLRSLLATRTAEVERWRKSATQLQNKYQSVNLEEYAAVREEAAAARARLEELEVGAGYRVGLCCCQHQQC
jgi:DNA repair exonuclease SbcCD ATPase subunit